MVSLIVGISIILNVLALLAVIVLYQRQNRLIEMEKNQKETIKELEETISMFILELKEDNEKLIEKLRDTLSKQSEKPGGNQEGHAMSGLDESNGYKGKTGLLSAVKAYKSAGKSYEEEKAGLSLNGSFIEEDLPAVKEAPVITNNLQDIQFPEDIVEFSGNPNSGNEEPPAAPEAGGHSEQAAETILEQAQTLQDQGFAEEEIARKLGRGKTEISLLLKFRQNRQE
ncbi:hypothetical protein [Bacillus infantis]|uniref:hypothetical protein n=1 Tax=Bacillus infantis TaxID=324767 RepID=UPI00296465C8|nr:hypothetical protein [Bacillus infantis]MDW2876916.1 hypothetical protein [Bacillus infantis]